MIHNFLKYLETECFSYKVTNGYEEITIGINNNSDYDILFKVSDFKNINTIVNSFCTKYNYKLVQVYHQEVYAKNFFVYDESDNNFLNLDLYGELSRKQIKLFEEEDIFDYNTRYQDISILKPHQEFIQYLIKKIDKEYMSETVFNQLKKLYQKQKKECDINLNQFFRNTHQTIENAFLNNEYYFIEEHIKQLKEDFNSLNINIPSNNISNSLRILKRIMQPTGLAIGFLGPDGSGKSTIINGLLDQTLPFRRKDYFHLKPIPQNKNTEEQVVTDPHQYKPYSFLKSYFKLFSFVYNISI